MVVKKLNNLELNTKLNEKNIIPVNIPIITFCLSVFFASIG
jgi:hypothetical protein